MQFASPYFLWLLAVIPLMVVYYVWRTRATFAPLSSVRTSGSTPTLPIKITLFTISPRYKFFIISIKSSAIFTPALAP